MIQALVPETVTIRTSKVLRRFVPSETLGFCIDGGDEGETARTFSAANVRRIRSAGLRPVAYRLRTELAGEAWHWNPEGTFSAGSEGYWTSRDRPGRAVLVSYGYRLPRRGNTFDQANNDGYSRLTDGDPRSFWKSNPYLNETRPQWILVRLPMAQTVNAVRVRWAQPYALRSRVEYWDGQNPDDVDGGQHGAWRKFPKGEFSSMGGDETRCVGGVEGVRWVRLSLLASSRTPRGVRDVRDATGFAVREIGIGMMGPKGFEDALIHRPDHGQSPVWVSSTDPWHRAIDRDPSIEQPGLDRLFRSRMTGGRKTLLPAGVLYDTPENMSALLRWVRARHYAIKGFELGEEPDGQVCDPHDYAALFLRTATALRNVDPHILLGGPGLQTIESDYARWAIGLGRRSWAGGFFAALEASGALPQLGFFSFEWYPFDDVTADPAVQLLAAPRLLRRALARQPIPAGLPTFMTEYGYSAYDGPAEVDLPAAILNLDIVGGFLSLRGTAAYLYGLPPAPLSEDRKGYWGTLAGFLPDGTRLPSFWAARIAMGDWCGRGPCSLLRVESGDPGVSAFALRRADGRLSVLLLNKDAHGPRLVLLKADGRAIGTGRLVQYGPDQYAWRAAGPAGRPLRSLPPRRGRFTGTIELPPYSVSVATF